MDKDALIYVAGHTGLVGSALVRALPAIGYTNLITRTREELDLMDRKNPRQRWRGSGGDYAAIGSAPTSIL